MQTTATFRLHGDSGLRTAAAVSSRLGLSPTRAEEAGWIRNPRRPRPRDASLWALDSSAEIETGVELAEQLHRLLDQLEPVKEQLWELANEGYQANWFCYVESNALEHAVELDRETLTRLLALPGDVRLDVCGDELFEAPTP